MCEKDSCCSDKKGRKETILSKGLWYTVLGAIAFIACALAIELGLERLGV